VAHVLLEHRTARTAALLAAGCALLALAGCGSTVTQPEKPWGPVSKVTHPHLSESARAEINKSLDQFVRDGVERNAPAAALRLATPTMRAGISRKGWLHGNLPVPPFDARGSFHGYSVLDANRNYADLTLILQPRHRHHDGAIAYQVRVRKMDGQWMLDWFVPTAFFAPAGKRPNITAEPDLGPGVANFLQPKPHANLIMIGILALLGLPVLVALVFGAVLVIRDRRRSGQPDDDRWADALRIRRG
jgi:hypothetical protein